MARSMRSIVVERVERQDCGHVSSDAKRLLKVDSYFVHSTTSLRNGRYFLTSFNPDPNSIYNLIWQSPAHSVQLVVE
jgi:hypothetical protein